MMNRCELKCAALLLLTGVSATLSVGAGDVAFTADATGESLVTRELQQAIDTAAKDGGGKVTVGPGTYRIGFVDMRSDVTLEVQKGATLLGSTNYEDYVVAGRRCDSLLRFSGVTNAAIVGGGTVDGNGGAWPKHEPGRKLVATDDFRPFNHLIDLRDSRDVRIEGITALAAGSWTIHPRRCDGVVIRGIRLVAHRNNCNDGIDIESRNVLIEDCDIDADDDGITFKTSAPDIVVENVEIRNCRVASSCSALKFGTETWGRFRNIFVHDVRIGRPSAQCRFDWRKSRRLFGVTDYLSGLAGIAIEAVDGASIDGVVFRNIEIEGPNVPIFVRLNRRHWSQTGEPSVIRNVLIENVRAKALSRVACSITGIPGLMPDGITLRNVEFVGPGGGTEAEAEATAVPEREGEYPECNMFHMALPACGFYVRHARNVRFENVRVSTLKPDARPPLYAEDAEVFADGACGFKAPKFDPEEGFKPLFNGRDFSGWKGATTNGHFRIDPDGTLVCVPRTGWKNFPLNLWTERKYADFALRFRFRIEPNVNNGIGIRAPEGQYVTQSGLEIQMLEDESTDYFHVQRKLQPYQYNCSVYGVLPAKRQWARKGYLRPQGEWNEEEIRANGSYLTVILNGETVVSADLARIDADGRTPDGRKHPGLRAKDGHIHICWHDGEVAFRDIRIRELGGK